MKKSTTAVCMIIYLLAVTLVFSIISVLCIVDTVDVYPSPDGTVDLTGIDFDTDVATIPAVAAMIYDGVFYTPEDFAASNITQNGFPYGSENGGMKDYGTVRIILKLPANRMYAISAKNTSYAQRLFINGEEYEPIGVTGESAESVTPKTTRYTEAFRPEGDTTEITIHYSNFVHADTGGLYPLTLGSVDKVTRIGQQKTLQVTVPAVALLTAMLFFFGLFLFFPKNRYLLWFSLACGCIALRGMLSSEKALMLFLPNLNWYLTIRMEYLTTCGMALFSALYLAGMFPGTVNKWAVWGFTAFCVFNAAFVCLAPALVFTAYITPILMVYVAFCTYLLLAITIAAIRKKNSAILSGTEQILLFTGLALYLILAAWEIYSYENAIYLLGLDYAQMGMMIFLFINLLTLALGFSRTEQKLNTALQSERELEASNQVLERLDRLKTDFLSNISHEMRTPLMVMSGYAQLTDWQIGAGSVDGETRENLRIVSQEALRLAELASGLLRVSAKAAWDRGAVNLTDIFGRADATCHPVLAKNSNRLETSMEKNLPPVQVNADMIFQVLLNLIVNANRHTRDGVIRLDAHRYTDDSIAVTVADNGGGIDPELLPHVFERHVSGDGGSGLGLAICKDAVESHGGEIAIENIPSGGTQVTFTLPVRKRKQKMDQTILLVEDNPDILKINRSALVMHGYRVLEAETAEQGWQMLERGNPDLIILDILLPDGNGLDFCEEVRKKSSLPILFLSALDENRDIVNGLLKGGDDYLPKPYDLDVLLARVAALLRRVGSKPEAAVTRGALSLDTVSQCALVNGADILLTPKEFAILLYLVRNEGKEIQTEQLYEAAWGQPMADDANTVRVAVSRLRSKIEPTGFQIASVRGFGYRFEESE